jgi:D12 class N6 adenine-specific DNA methyltransferase
MAITIPYPGGKARLARFIISQLPKQGRYYVEPFVGRGNLFWAAACAGLQFDKWWLNDIATAPFFEAIRKLGDKIEVPQCARHEYERQRDAYSSGDPTAILLEPFLTFTGGGYLHSGFRGDKRGDVSPVRYQKTLRECHKIMSRTRPRLSNSDWREMGLDELGPQDTVVLDPPYTNTTPLSYTDATVDYHELVDLLLRAKFRWVLCGYLHPALHRLGNPSWAKDVRFLCPRREEARRTECLWTNLADDVAVKRYSLPLAVRGRLLAQNHASKLSFHDLDQKIDKGLGIVALERRSLRLRFLAAGDLRA